VCCYVATSVVKVSAEEASSSSLVILMRGLCLERGSSGEVFEGEESALLKEDRSGNRGGAHKACARMARWVLRNPDDHLLREGDARWDSIFIPCRGSSDCKNARVTSS